MTSSTVKNLSRMFRAARKGTTTAKKATSTTKKGTKSIARSSTSSSVLDFPSIRPIADVDFSDSAPSEHSYNNLWTTAFPYNRSPLGKLSELISTRIKPPFGLQTAQDEHVEDAGDHVEDADEHVKDSNMLRQVSSTIKGSSDLQVRHVNGEIMLSSICMIVPDDHIRAPQHNKEVSQERKKKWIYKNTHDVKIKKLIESCADRFGSGATISVFDRLGLETGLKEYNALLRICIESAKRSEDEGVLLEQIYKAYKLFKSMKEQGFQIHEETYGPFLMFLIDMHMVEEFFFFLETIKDENSSSNSRFGYYEMLLAIEVNDETKIQELSNQIASRDNPRISALQEQYLMAICVGGRKKELLEVLERIDITQVSSVENLYRIFSTLGRLSLEFYAVKFISELKECDHIAQSISILLSNYATSITDISVEVVLSKFRSMHQESGVVPSSLSYENIIKFCCNSFEVHEALIVANQMVAEGLTLSMETINYMLHTCEERAEYHLVHSIYSMLSRFDWKPNSDTYRSLINLSVRAKDIQSAFSMLEDMQKVDVSPTSNIYNAIMAGFYREKNVKGALGVLERMEAANIKPDSITFSFLIANADCEEDIIKYCEMLKSSGVQATKHVFMGLINAYANCGQFDKAKKVVQDNGLDVKEMNELKSVLASALASNGCIIDALEIYKDLTLNGCSLQPKAIISLIEHLQSSDKLSTMLQLVNELSGRDYWIDGSCRVIGYCLRNKNLSVAVDLLEVVTNKFHDNVMIIESVINEAFSVVADLEPPDVQLGLDLLHAIKDELMLEPTRRCLDFLLSTCVTAKDPQSAALIWEEYSAAGLPHNILGLLRLYQVFMASGDHELAEDILKNIPFDDPHVYAVIAACRRTYAKSSKKNKTKKLKKPKKKKSLETQ